MMDTPMPVRAPQVPAAAPRLPQAGVELRILSGCHEGAALAIAQGQRLRVGCDDDCDVLLRDCGLAPGESLEVEWAQGRWLVLPAGDGDVAGVAPASHALGMVALLGQVSATVCAEHAPWQAPVPEPFAPSAAAAPVEPSVQSAAPVPAPSAPAPPPRVDSTSSAGKRARPRRIAPWSAAVLGVACVAVLGVAWAAWHLAPEPVHNAARREADEKPALSPQAQGQAVKNAGLAIALVDPALRMAIAPNAEGGVTVSGWVDNVEQFDRLAQALSGLRPLPRLAVRTASEVLDVLSDAGSAQGVQLKFALLGAGKVRATGVVATRQDQQALLGQLRARAPQGIEVVDGLRVAAEQGPAIRSWLQAHGFAVTRAEWDGEQVVLGVDVGPTQRAPLEHLLAGAATPLTGVPFLLQSRVLKTEAEAAAQRPRIGDAGLPIRIRSVVGGAAPYVVLADGAKLQPGGRHAGWRLVAIEQDHLVLDGPKRLEITR